MGRETEIRAAGLFLTKAEAMTRKCAGMVGQLARFAGFLQALRGADDHATGAPPIPGTNVWGFDGAIKHASSAVTSCLGRLRMRPFEGSIKVNIFVGAYCAARHSFCSCPNRMRLLRSGWWVQGRCAPKTPHGQRSVH